MSSSSPPPPSAGVPSDRGDGEHDAWLRAALRHAPDADALPPESLRRSILDEARAAAFARAQAGTRGTGAPRADATRRSTGMVGTVAAFWGWLARPAVAAGFASVMAATLVGVMWWDRPLDETLPSPTPPVAAMRQTPAAAERAAAKPEPFVPTPIEPSAPRVPSISAPLARPAPPMATAAEDKRSRADLDRPSAFKQRVDAASRTTAAEPTAGDAAPTPVPAPAPAAVPMPPPGSGSDTAAPAAATPPPVPAALQARAAVALAKTAPAAPTPPPETIRDELRSTGSVDGTLGRASPRAFTNAAASRPLAELLDGIAAEPARWSVQRADGEHVALDEPVRAWLARVDATVGVASTGAAVGATSDRKSENKIVAGPAVTLSLLRDGQLDTVVRIQAGRVVVERHDRPAATTTTASLPAEAAAALAASLPAGAR